MTTVFIAGSRAVSKLNKKITERLDNIMNRHLAVLVGDANGADKAIQRYLAKSGYRNVTVYCMETCRNNLGDWPICHHAAAPRMRRDRSYYTIKDLEMAAEATCGFMLWDGRSRGTLANVLTLLDSGKKVLLYVSSRKSFFRLSSHRDLHETLESIGVQNVPQFLISAKAAGPAPLLGFG